MTLGSTHEFRQPHRQASAHQESSYLGQHCSEIRVANANGSAILGLWQICRDCQKLRFTPPLFSITWEEVIGTSLILNGL